MLKRTAVSVLVVLVVALTLTAVPAFASTEPLDDPANDAAFWNIMNNPFTAADPAIGGVTYNDVKVKSGIMRGEIAGRILPKLSATANVALAVVSVPAAFQTGLQIGGTVSSYLNLAGNDPPDITAGPSIASNDVQGYKVLPVASSPTYSVTSGQWASGASAAGESYIWVSCSGGCTPGNQVGSTCTAGTCGVFFEQFTTGSTSSFPIWQFVNTDRCGSNTIGGVPPGAPNCGWSSATKEADYYMAWAKAKAMQATGYWHFYPLCDSSVGSNDNGNDCRYTLWASETDYEKWLTVTKAGSGTDPSPVPNEPSVSYTQPSFTAADHNAARAALKDGSAPEARRWVDCELNPSSTWCTDASATGGASTGSTTTTLAPGSTVGVTGTVNAFTPFALPEPGVNEAYGDYIGRLRALGWVGTIIRTTASTPNVAMGPSAIAGLTLDPSGTPLAVLDASPAGWPDNAPVVQSPTESLAISVNPSTVPRVSFPGVPNINFGPLTSLSPGCKFPYGLFCWAQDVTGWFNVTPAAPDFTFHIPGLHIGGTYYGASSYTYDVSLSGFDTYMGWIRDLISVVLWVGAVYWVASRFLGFGAGGDPGEAVDEAL